MLANWGYQDGSGEYFITIDADKCDGCGKCADACPQNALEIGEDPVDPLRDDLVAFVSEEQRNKLRAELNMLLERVETDSNRIGEIVNRLLMTS